MTDNQASILVIEDERPMRRFLEAALASQGYRVLEAEGGKSGIALAALHKPDIVILDLGLPDIDGLTVAERLREWSPVPIIVLSARGRENDKVAALDTGADDYLTKPFGVQELLARIRVALRHSARFRVDSADPVFSVGGLRVDLAARRVAVGGRDVSLTPIEYRLLTTMVANAGKVLTHAQLLREVWGPGYGREAHYVRVYMAQLRHKIEPDPARPRYFLTEQGVGYRLAAE